MKAKKKNSPPPDGRSNAEPSVPPGASGPEEESVHVLARKIVDSVPWEDAPETILCTCGCHNHSEKNMQFLALHIAAALGSLSTALDAERRATAEAQDQYERTLECLGNEVMAHQKTERDLTTRDTELSQAREALVCLETRITRFQMHGNGACRDCPHPLIRHAAVEGQCLDCSCIGWTSAMTLKESP